MTPLASFGVLRTTDVDDARASIAASLAPHRLIPLDAAGGFRALHNAAPLGQVSMHYIDYGTEVEVQVDGMDFALVQIPMAGLTTIAHRAEQTLVTARAAAMTSAGEPVTMRYSAGNPRLMVRIGASLLSERMDLASRVSMIRTPDVTTFDVTRGPGWTWRALLDVALADLDRDAGLVTAPLAARTVELALVDGLIASLASESATAIDIGADPASPSARVMRRAAELIEDHCAEPLVTADIAEAVGLSVRALRAGFQTHHATTPMAYLRMARLRRVRDSLRDRTAATVTEAATRWGITHLGRLSGDYRKLFGESPSETLRRSR